MLLDFLRLLRQRKVTEMQAVRGQLAGLDTDLAEATHRLERVVAAAAPARQLQSADDRVAAAMRAVSQAALEGEAGGTAGSADVRPPALRSRSLPPASAQPPAAAAPVTATAAATTSAPPTLAASRSRKRGRDENEAEHSPAAGKAEGKSAALIRGGLVAASKVARIMAAFPAADVAYLARRAAAAKAAGRQPQGATVADGGGATVQTAAAAAMQELTSPTSLGGGQAEHANAPRSMQLQPEQPADDHLTLFMEDIAAFTRYREIKVAFVSFTVTLTRCAVCCRTLPSLSFTAFSHIIAVCTARHLLRCMWCLPLFRGAQHGLRPSVRLYDMLYLTDVMHGSSGEGDSQVWRPPPAARHGVVRRL